MTLYSQEWFAELDAMVPVDRRDQGEVIRELEGGDSLAELDEVEQPAPFYSPEWAAEIEQMIRDLDMGAWAMTTSHILSVWATGLLTGVLLAAAVLLHTLP